MNCTWVQDGAGEEGWDTGCRKRFTLIDGTPSDNKMAFCCYCGQPLEEIVASDQEEYEEGT